jgi:hypothetical protein
LADTRQVRLGLKLFCARRGLTYYRWSEMRSMSERAFDRVGSDYIGRQGSLYSCKVVGEINEIFVLHRVDDFRHLRVIPSPRIVLISA